MQKQYQIIVFSLFSIILISQISIVAYAHHADDQGEKARKEAEKRSKDIEKKNAEKIKEIRDALEKYRTAFNAWKIASENYKKEIIKGSQEKIDASKIILDKTILDKKQALDELIKTKKK